MPGRPPLPRAARLVAGVLVRLRAAEREALRERAAAAGVTVGVFSREVLRRHLAEPGS